VTVVAVLSRSREPDVSDNLQWLQNFYASLCDGLWEHGYGCNLDTLDNPGWKFIFELNGTPFEKASGLDVRLGEHVDVEGPDWIILEKGDHVVHGVCGPTKLDEMLGLFRAWIEKQI
jgi:hypothetical protein|tara:strand:- start:15312 stop:15662 length:351 start_codon:yes stop_codon:yes gene_type:complete